MLITSLGAQSRKTPGKVTTTPAKTKADQDFLSLVKQTPSYQNAKAEQDKVQAGIDQKKALEASKSSNPKKNQAKIVVAGKSRIVTFEGDAVPTAQERADATLYYLQKDNPKVFKQYQDIQNQRSAEKDPAKKRALLTQATNLIHTGIATGPAPDEKYDMGVGGRISNATDDLANGLDRFNKNLKKTGPIMNVVPVIGQYKGLLQAAEQKNRVNSAIDTGLSIGTGNVGSALKNIQSLKTNSEQEPSFVAGALNPQNYSIHNVVTEPKKYNDKLNEQLLTGDRAGWVGGVVSPIADVLTTVAGHIPGTAIGKVATNFIKDGAERLLARGGKALGMNTLEHTMRPVNPGKMAEIKAKVNEGKMGNIKIKSQQGRIDTAINNLVGDAVRSGKVSQAEAPAAVNIWQSATQQFIKANPGQDPAEWIASHSISDGAAPKGALHQGEVYAKGTQADLLPVGVWVHPDGTSYTTTRGGGGFSHEVQNANNGVVWANKSASATKGAARENITAVIRNDPMNHMNAKVGHGIYFDELDTLIRMGKLNKEDITKAIIDSFDGVKFKGGGKEHRITPGMSLDEIRALLGQKFEFGQKFAKKLQQVNASKRIEGTGAPSIKEVGDALREGDPFNQVPGDMGGVFKSSGKISTASAKNVPEHPSFPGLVEGEGMGLTSEPTKIIDVFDKGYRRYMDVEGSKFKKFSNLSQRERDAWNEKYKSLGSASKRKKFQEETGMRNTTPDEKGFITSLRLGGTHEVNPSKLQDIIDNSIVGPGKKQLLVPTVEKGTLLTQTKPGLIPALQVASKDLTSEQLEILKMFRESDFDGSPFQPLLQKDGKNVKGWYHAATKTIGLMEGADFSTFMHESFHAWTDVLHPEHIANLEKHFGKAGTKDFYEGSARAFERYLYDGIAPSTEVKGVFDAVKESMGKIYSKIKGTPLEKDVHPEIRNMFDDIFGGGAKKVEAKPTVTKTPGRFDSVDNVARFKGNESKTTTTQKPPTTPKTPQNESSSNLGSNDNPVNSGNSVPPIKTPNKPSPLPDEPNGLPDGQTGISNKQQEDLAMKGYLSSAPKGKGMTFEEMDALVEQKRKDIVNHKPGVNPDKLADDIKNGGKVDEHDVAVIKAQNQLYTAESYRLETAMAQVPKGSDEYARLSGLFDENMTKHDDFLAKIQHTKTRASNIFRMFATTEDITNPEGLAAWAKRKGVDTDSKEYANLKKATDDYHEAKTKSEHAKQMAAKDKEVADANKARDDAQNALNDILAKKEKKQPGKREPKTNFEQRRTENKSKREMAQDRIKNKLENFKPSSDGGMMTAVPFAHQIEKLIEITPEIAVIAQTYIDDGITNLAELTKKIHDATDNQFKDSEIHGVLAGHYKKPTQSTDALSEMKKLELQANDSLKNEMAKTKESIQKLKSRIESTDPDMAPKKPDKTMEPGDLGSFKVGSTKTQDQHELEIALKKYKQLEAEQAKFNEQNRSGQPRTNILSNLKRPSKKPPKMDEASVNARSAKQAQSEANKEYAKWWKDSEPGEREAIYNRMEKIKEDIAKLNDGTYVPKPKKAPGSPALDEDRLRLDVLDQERRKALARYKSKEEYDKLSPAGKFLKNTVGALADGTRGLVAGADMSAPLNQGFPLIFSDPLTHLRASGKALKAMKSTEELQKVLAELKQDPYHNKVMSTGAKIDADKILEQEQGLIRRLLGRKESKNLSIKGYEFGVYGQSERHMAAWLAYARFHKTKSAIRFMESPFLGSRRLTPELMKEVGAYTNSWIGASDTWLGDTLSKAGVMFSGRFKASIIEQGIGYTAGRAMVHDPKLGLLAMKDLSAFYASTVGAVIVWNKVHANEPDKQISVDPRNSKFMTPTVGGMEIPILASRGAFTKVIARVVFGDENGKKDWRGTPGLIGQFFLNSMAPLPKTVYNSIEGESFGKSYDVKTFEGWLNILHDNTHSISAQTIAQIDADPKLSKAQKISLMVLAIHGASVNPEREGKGRKSPGKKEGREQRTRD